MGDELSKVVVGFCFFVVVVVVVGASGSSNSSSSSSMIGLDVGYCVRIARMSTWCCASRYGGVFCGGGGGGG